VASCSTWYISTMTPNMLLLTDLVAAETSAAASGPLNTTPLGGPTMQSGCPVMLHFAARALYCVASCRSAHGAAFTSTETGCDLIAPGAACTIDVVFTPTNTFGETAGLYGTPPGGPTIIIALEARSTGGLAPFLLSPFSSDFGSVAIGATSPSVTFTVSIVSTLRSCSEDITAPPFAVTLSSADFVITDDTCSTNVIPVGGTCTFDILLKPTSAGAKGALVVVGWPSYTKTFAVTGTGTSIIDAGPLEPVDSGID